MGQYDALFTPLSIRNMTIRNRIMSTSHAPAYDEDGMPGERYQRYHEEKAKGGIGLTMFGGSSGVSFESKVDWGQLSLASDRVIPYLQQFSERIHGHGAKLMIQMAFMGKKIQWDQGEWFIPLGPSRPRERWHAQYAKEVEDWDIARIVRAFGQAARRAKQGGLDGCEISAHANQILDVFWSPRHNRRTDKYGGSFENRMRLGREVMEEMRKQVGEDFVIGIRMSGAELVEEGMEPEECRATAAYYAREGLVDFLNISAGSIMTRMSHSKITPNMSWPVAPYLHLASAIKAEVDIPVFHATRIQDPATAARAIEDGHIDMVAMTRAHIADPYFVEKLREGREDDIRQCVGASYCLDRLYTGGGALCIQNAATGRERTMPHKISKGPNGAKKVVVIGGGPGGMEAARVSAERGHDVVLFEGTDRMGGQINLATKIGHRENLSGVTRWLESQTRKLPVDLRMQTMATAEVVKAEAPDLVIVATGGRPNPGRFHDSALVATGQDILSGRVAPGETVLVYDDQNDHQGVSVAEYLAERGARVELVTPDWMTASKLGPTNRPIHIRNLHARGVVMTPDLRLEGVEAEGNRIVAVLHNDYSEADEERLVDQVVVEHGTLPNEELYFALRPDSANLGEVDFDALLEGRPQEIATNPAGAYRLFRIGDAVTSRNIHAAIYDALRLCKDF